MDTRAQILSAAQDLVKSSGTRYFYLDGHRIPASSYLSSPAFSTILDALVEHPPQQLTLSSLIPAAARGIRPEVRDVKFGEEEWTNQRRQAEASAAEAAKRLGKVEHQGAPRPAVNDRFAFGAQVRANPNARAGRR